MSADPFTKEKRILMAMRKTLGKIVKDVTPASSALRSPLSAGTIEDIKVCFNLIAARERELALQAGIDIKSRPQFIDEPSKDNVVSISALKATLPSRVASNENKTDLSEVKEPGDGK